MGGVDGGGAGRRPRNACFLSSAEFAQFTGGNPQTKPDLLIDTMCEYDNGEIQLNDGAVRRTHLKLRAS